MIFFRRRLFLWLIKAYIKKWGKRIFLFFIVGLVLFFSFFRTIHSFVTKIPSRSHESIGVVGDFKVETLPRWLLDTISEGLTKNNEDGTVIPSLAVSWKVLDDGKRYEFFLKKDEYFTDGTKLDSSHIQYNFADVVVERPNEHRIVFKLKDSYSPFTAISVSRPVFKNGLIGTGEYRVRKVELNAGFVESLTLQKADNPMQTKTYHFYSKSDVLKMAFLMGEVDIAKGLHDITYKGQSLANFSNVKVVKTTNDSRLVTLFYNTKDNILSDEKIRNALSYGLPDEFPAGKRHTTPFKPSLWVNSQSNNYERKQDIEHALELLESSSASKSANVSVKIQVFPKYKSTAERIKSEWKKIRVDASIEEVQSVPTTFQIFLGDFMLSNDPDQYTLWHSTQAQNITNYQNLRIDKLLEDGRKTSDIEKRRTIYENFQKYLLADSPASFLFFPYEYDIIRK